MKYVCYCFLFVFMTCQFAHAQYLEYVEYDDKADVYINGSCYVRVPYNSYKSVGYNKFKKLNKEDEDNYKINNKEAPDNQKLQLLFALGLANYNFEVEQSGAIYNETINNGNLLEFSTKDGKDVTAVRIGSGFEYNFNDYIAFRSLFRYIHMLNDDFFKHMFELSMGLRFSM